MSWVVCHTPYKLVMAAGWVLGQLYYLLIKKQRELAVRQIMRSLDLSEAEAVMDVISSKNDLALKNSVKQLNGSLYRKITEIREKILELALSCVGNPYVWGGTSLTNGADCSGFVQTLYSRFGYHLPRVADAQSRYGTQIPVSDAAPGDLVFFARNGYVYHVAMYAGDGKTVEAYSSNYGIITKELSDRNVVWATRIIED